MSDFKEWSTEDLSKEVADKREALRSFRFGESGGRTRNVREGRNLRREIARMMTELNSRRTQKVEMKGKNA
jgi:ribosomal protein L29